MRARALGERPSRFDHEPTVELAGRAAVAGDELAIAGKRGRFRLRAHTTNPSTGDEWVDVYGPLGSQRARLRSFRLEDVTQVHRRREHDR